MWPNGTAHGGYMALTAEVDMESLVCPVCLDLPSGEVHQCFEGAIASAPAAGTASTRTGAPRAMIGSQTKIAIGTERQGSPPWLPPATTAA